MDHWVAFRSARTAAVVIVLLGALTGQCSWAAPQGGARKAESSGNADNGKRIFRSVGCWQCHGFVGQGQEGNGARIGPPQLALPAFLTYVRHPRGQMPPYELKAISDADLTDVYAFLQSIPKPPPVKDIPLLNN